MKIFFKVPFKCYISGPAKESLNLQAVFEESGYSVNLVLSAEDGEAMELENVPKEDKYFIEISNMKFFLSKVSDDKNMQIDYKSLATDTVGQRGFFELFVKIVNRSLQAIRNFGVVPHIQTFNPDTSRMENYLRFWDVKILEDNNEYNIFPMPNLLGFALAGNFPLLSDNQNIPDLHIYRWPDIEEALQDQSDPPPEKEFFTNTLEFIRIRNFRMALLESIICLEIVLTQYLKSFLKIKKNIPDNRIKIFLRPEMGFSARVSVLLDLTLEQNDLADVEIIKVIRAIGWRNDIIHKTGRLPENIKEEDLRDCISHVLVLSQILARKKRQIESEPALQVIAKEIAENNKVPLPNIWSIGRHLYSIKINFLFQEIPGKDVLEKVANELVEKLKNYDGRFIPNKHLFIRFLRFPDKVCARWRGGVIEILEEGKLVVPEGPKKDGNTNIQ